jgi:hypothetical protein
MITSNRGYATSVAVITFSHSLGHNLPVVNRSRRPFRTEESHSALLIFLKPDYRERVKVVYRLVLRIGVFTFIMRERGNRTLHERFSE